MFQQSLKELYTRDLQKLKEEISAYKTESNLWIISREISNSGGNLCMHLVGNLKTFIGNGLADINYVRQRDQEFGAKNIPRIDLLNDIEETIKIVNDALDSLTENQLTGQYPMKIWKHETGMAFTLIHLHSHLNYHLGQINYHRRLLDN